MHPEDIPPKKPSHFSYYIKPLIRPFVLLFVLFFFAINFENVIWIFNKEALTQSIKDRTHDLVLQGQGDATPIINIKPSQKVEAEVVPSGDSFLRIPKIELDKKIAYPTSTEVKTIDEALMGKVMHFPQTPYPGQKGDAIFLAHSAPITWGPSYRVFNKIDKLEVGDDIVISFNGQDYVYRVLKRYLINPGDALPESTGQKKAYFLTCWPPDSGIKRMVVEALLA